MFAAFRPAVLLTCVAGASWLAYASPGPATAQELKVHNGIPPRSITLLETTWRFMDASGASFTARFRPNGAFEGPAGDRLWKWEIGNGRLVIVFDNGMGTRIVREGRFIDPDWLNGEARTDGGKSWSWVAHRVVPPKRDTAE